MRKLWLIFAQAATISLAVLFVVSTLRPDLLSFGGRNGGVVTIRESQNPSGGAAELGSSYSAAARRSMGAVVNIFTTKDVKAQRHPFMDDPVFRRFFGDQFDGEPQRTSSLGSGVIVSTLGSVA